MGTYSFSDLLSMSRTYSGHIHIRGLGANRNLKGNKLRNFASNDDAVAYAYDLASQGYDTYFATAEMDNAGIKAKGANFVDTKIIPLDFDVGPLDKKYDTIEEAWGACYTLMNTIFGEGAEPCYFSILSGYGLQAHILMQTPIDSYKRRILGSKIARVARNLSLKMDYPVTKDIVRIMRVPGTYNYKAGGAVLVEMVGVPAVAIHPDYLEQQLDTLLTSSEVSECLQDVYNDAADHEDDKALANPIFKDTDFQRNGYDSPHAVWSVIKQISLATEMKKVKELNVSTGKMETVEIEWSLGCEVVRRGFDAEECNNMPEPVWRAQLSWIQHTVGTDDEKRLDAENISNQHKAFDRDEMIGKMVRSEGKPLSCQFVEGTAPHYCKHCPHKGTFKNPLALSRTYRQADAGEEVLIESEMTGGTVMIKAPTRYPPRYSRKEGGGVIYKPPSKKRSKDGIEIPEPEVLISRVDLWMEEHINNGTNMGFSGLWFVRTLHDGGRTFTMPSADISKEFHKKAQSEGVYMPYVPEAMLVNYALAWSEFLANAGKASTMRMSMGWHDDHTRFMIGGREIDRDRERLADGNPDDRFFFSPMTDNVTPIAAFYQKEGCLDDWKRVIASYGLPGNELRAFTLCVSLGTPLYSLFTGLGGCILHLYSPKSGTGKTTVQYVAQSAWGHPSNGALNKKDTQNAMFNRLGIYRHLPAIIDELTGAHVDELQELVFGVSQNRGKNRLSASANVERINTSSFSTIVITSGNESIREKFRSEKGSAEGEQMRLIELSMEKSDAIGKAEADELFQDVLNKNYGMAGETLIREIIKDVDKHRDALYAIRKQIDGIVGFTEQHRFYSGTVSVAFYAATLGKTLGIHDFDVKAVFKEVFKTFREMVGNQQVYQKSRLNPEEVLNSFIANNHNGINRVQGQSTANDGGRSNVVVGKINPGLNRIWVRAESFRKHCETENVSMDQVLKELGARGRYLGQTVEDFGEGTGITMDLQAYEFVNDLGQPVI